jgi:hypothetical protein
MPETMEWLSQEDPLEGDLAPLLAQLRMQETLLVYALPDDAGPAPIPKDGLVKP